MEVWKQLPLWLWEVHNDVNLNPEALWPSENQCKLCRKPQKRISWDKDAVYEFLQKEYWPSKVANINQKLPTIPKNYMLNPIKIHEEESYSSTYSISTVILFFFAITLPLIFSWFWLKKIKKSISGRHKKTDFIDKI